jgi:hypothetical protein
MDALHALRRDAVAQWETLREVAEHLDSLTAMAEFVGEQTVPNFAAAVKGFKDSQAEELRKRGQTDNGDQCFKESLDADVRRAGVEREKEAEAMREVFRRSHQAKQTE